MQRIPGAGSLTPDQISFYDTEGYLVLENALNKMDMSPVIAALSQKVDMIADELVADGIVSDPLKHVPFKYRLARLFDGRTDKDFLKYGRSWRDRFPGYFEFMSNPKIVQPIVSLIGPEVFSNPVYNVRPKVPRVAAGAVPWHQDKSYWPDANANPVITAWIPLVDSTMENGCLHLIPRTQKEKVLTWHADEYTGTGYTEIDEKHMRLLKLGKIIALPVTAGSIIFFNDRLVHSSTPNNSDHVRWSLDLRYQPTDQDPMPQHGAGFLVHSAKHPERVATREDWLAERPEHKPEAAAANA
jgi:ectoine hydroxylase-related dioxygenase (phytanoyl-CoA dioxygenase family)